MNNPCQGTTREHDWSFLAEKIECAHSTAEIKWLREQQEIVIRQSKDEGLEALRRDLIAINREEWEYMEAKKAEVSGLLDRMSKGEDQTEEDKALEAEIATIKEEVDSSSKSFKERIDAQEKLVKAYCKKNKL